MRNHMEQDAEEPCATVGSGCESFKRLQCLKVRLLHRIFRLGAVVQNGCGGTIEVIEMWQRLRFELGCSVGQSACRNPVTQVITGPVFKRHSSIPFHLALSRYDGISRKRMQRIPHEPPA